MLWELLPKSCAQYTCAMGMGHLGYRKVQVGFSGRDYVWPEFSKISSLGKEWKRKKSRQEHEQKHRDSGEVLRRCISRRQAG